MHSIIKCPMSVLITWLHATLAIFMASFAVSVYLLAFYVRTFLGEHQLEIFMGEKLLPQSWIGFLSLRDMNIHCCLQLLGLDAGSLFFPMHSTVPRGSSPPKQSQRD